MLPVSFPQALNVKVLLIFFLKIKHFISMLFPYKNEQGNLISPLSYVLIYT